MQQPSKPSPGSRSAPAVLAREVAELHREKMELLEENASLEERSRVSAWPVLFAWELYLVPVLLPAR
jgi:hypothetical protein